MEDKKIQIEHYELKSMADSLTSMAGRLLAMCETEKAKGKAKGEKKENAIAKSALLLKLKD
jgi:hypothetical protein